MVYIKNSAGWLLLFFVKMACAQTSLSVRSGVGYVEPTQPALAYEYAHWLRQPSASQSIEALIGFRLNKKISIGSGLQYERQSFHFDNVLIFSNNLFSSFAPEPILGRTEKVLHFVNIPFSVYYHFGPKNRVYMGAAVAQRFFLIQKDKETFTNSQGVEIFQTTSFTTPLINVSTGIEVGYNFKCGPRNYFSTGLFYKSIFGRTPDVSARMINYFGLIMGYQFTNLIKEPDVPGKAESPYQE